MKIALISNMYPSEKDPVFGVFVKNTEKLLEEYGVHTIAKAVSLRSKFLFSKLGSYAILYLKIIAIFCFKKVDLVYIHFPLQTSLLLLLLHKFSSKKMVLNIHGSELNEKSLFFGFFKKLLNKSNLLVVPSKVYKTKLVSRFKLDPNSIFVYPSGGINAKLFYPQDKDEIRKKLGIEQNAFVCSYISSIIETKGWHTFVEAAQILKQYNILFIVVGNGQDEEKMKNRVNQLGLNSNFRFFDKQNQSQLAQFYNASDLFIFPTQKESLGLVGIEALACGTPIIASNIEACSEYVKEGFNGFLFEKDKPISLAQKVEKFYDCNSKEEFKKQALHTAKKFNSKSCSFALAEKLKQL